MDINYEKLKYLLNDMENHILCLIEEVLVDSKTDPCYSAVFVSNKIKCYIQIMDELGSPCPYNTVTRLF